MIQEIKIKNFLSFKDEVRFSFDASNDKFAEDCQVVQVNENTRLLRFAVVYGYNASGKSNLLKAFNFLVSFWNGGKNVYDKIGVTPFKLDANTPIEHSKFELTFFVGSTKYVYQLELDNSIVYFEKLAYYKTIQPVKLFTREYKNDRSVISYGADIKLGLIEKSLIAANCIYNMSYFEARNKVNTRLPLIDEAENWLLKNLFPTVTPFLNLTAIAQNSMINSTGYAKYLLDFLENADFNITDVETYLVKQNDSDKFGQEIGIYSSTFSNVKKTEVEHSVENERGVEKYKLSLNNNEESSGTIRTFGLASVIFEALKENAFASIDEIESSLHPQLIEKILYEFLRKTDSRSQLLVTTHYDGLLDLVDDLIRKDSVWFTEKQKTGATDLYKLTDFRGVNRLSSIRDAYRNKRFGATMK